MDQALHLSIVLNQIDKICSKKPEITMTEAVAIFDAKSEERSALQKRADELYPDEMAQLFRDPDSIREAIGEMSDAEVKALVESPEIFKACLRYFEPIARKSAIERAEGEQ